MVNGPAGHIQARPGQSHIAQADQIAGHGHSLRRCRQPAMHGHGLSGDLDAAGRAERAIGAAQRVVGGAVAVGEAVYGGRIPVQHLVEQAHGAAMRDQRQNLVAAKARHASGSGQPAGGRGVMLSLSAMSDR